MAKSLVGRISYKELHPLSIAEFAPDTKNTLWVRGGFPSAFLAQDHDKAFDWIDNFVRTYIERELGVSILRAAPMELALFLRVLASMHGLLVNFAHLSQV
ncbi:MAG: hypothetical protein KGS48_08260 [Bacteroidetes bacterium]|nr:hypothetical protein [Bacteroidota bacterium]